ncbi:MAG: hypothetical protein KME40_20040 [Komarekiella atlantica HA4396-MV6]|nr:hypothetical protein [Komarekiella atlantica HA4396-MV6]
MSQILRREKPTQTGFFDTLGGRCLRRATPTHLSQANISMQRIGDR